MITPYRLLFAQIVAHLSIIPMILYGHWYHWVIAFFVYFLTGCFGMTMTFHRLLSHKSWNPPKWFEYVGTFLGTYGLTGSSIAWTAIHREHHHHTDDEQDPHSPLYKGFVHVQWMSMFDIPKPRYAAHLLRSKYHVFLHKNYMLIHLCILVTLLAINPMLAVSAYLFPAAILWNMGSFINTISHMVGYRNAESNDHSRNVYWLGYLMWGEGWHNNHHANPTNSSFKVKWWEFDVGGWFIERLNTKPVNRD